MKNLLRKIREAGLILSVDEGKLQVFSSTGVADEGLIAEIKNHREEILACLPRDMQLSREKTEAIPRCAENTSYALSNAQMRLWLASQTVEGSTAYNMPGSLVIEGANDVACLVQAVHAVIRRHEILRTVFRLDDGGEVRQYVLSPEALRFNIDYKDCRGEADAELVVRTYIAEDSRRPFDLAEGPLLRAALLRLSDARYVFYYTLHHIISDDWSMEVLRKDVLSYYEAYRENRKPDLKELPIQYKDYSAWQLRQLHEDSFGAHRTYWLDKLSGKLPRLDLPGTKKRPRIRTYNGSGLATYLDAATVEKLKRFSHENAGSLFMSLLAAWNILMYRYTSENDIIVGTPIAGREHADLKDQIGFYVNTLVFRNTVDPTQSFTDFCSKVKESTVSGYSHQAYPFDKLAEELDLTRDPGRSAVFDILLDFHNAGKKAEVREEEVNSISESGKLPVKYDVEIHFAEVGSNISIQACFNDDVYEKHVIKTIIAHYKSLISQLLDNANTPIKSVDFLSADDKKQLLHEFNDTKTDYPKEKTVIQLFEEQATRTPDQAAIKYGEKVISYRALNELSNQLARCIITNYGVRQGDLVGIKLDKVEWAVISMLGVLKAGAAYVPLDPEYAPSKRHYILVESNIALLITDTRYLFDEPGFEGHVFAVDVEFEKDKYSTKWIGRHPASESAAYVIYTSGSTGQPKGVMVNHRSLTNYLISACATYSNRNAEPLDFGLFTSLSFDLTITSLYLPLITGGALWIFDPATTISSVLTGYFQQGIGCIKLTPAHVSLLKDLALEQTSVKVAIVGGDKLENVHVETLRKLNSGMRIFNEYGPTESTVGCVVKEVLSEKEDLLIGRPMSNTEIFILSEMGQLQPIGVIGEICIGGDGLAVGYLNQQELTAQKFIENPFKKGERLYKTGDLGRWLPDGVIAFIGRKDNQVKIRGYRVELGEVEHALLKNDEIIEAVVLARKNVHGENELVAYLVSKEEQNTNTMNRHLKELLPDYMLPSYYVQMKALPLTTNGKIDKKSLPDPQDSALESGVEYAAPENETEAALVGIWERILQRNPIGVNDDFFAIGGHSLLAVKLSFAIAKMFGVNLDLTKLFQYPTVKLQARYLQMISANSGDGISIEKDDEEVLYL